MKDFKTFYIDTLGCPKNEVDSRIIEKSLILLGRKPINPEKADIIIVNSCGFLQEAIEELEEVVRDWLKKGKRVLVTGCAVERYGYDFFSNLNVDYAYLDDLVGFRMDGKRKQITLPTFDNQHFEGSSLLHYLKVQEGCSRRCSYCVISKIRGPLRSRPISDIIKEIEYLKDHGVKEFDLIAQDLTLYGVDFGENLVNLIRKLPDGVYYRLLYLHPNGITKELISVINDKGSILPYLHIPIQHVSQRVLSSMKRAGGERAVRRVFEMVRRELPNFYLRVDIIVGFPTETDEDFEMLLDFLEKERPERISLFKYSHEPQTASYKLEDLGEEIKEERYQITYEIAYEVMEESQRRLIDREILIFKEGNTSWSQYDSKDVDFSVFIKGVLGNQWFGMAKIIDVNESLEVVGVPVRP